MANSVDLDQTAPIGAVCSGPTLFASILNSSVMLGNYLQQTTSADGFSRRHFKLLFFLGTLRVKEAYVAFHLVFTVCQRTCLLVSRNDFLHIKIGILVVDQWNSAVYVVGT